MKKGVSLVLVLGLVLVVSFVFSLSNVNSLTCYKRQTWECTTSACTSCSTQTGWYSSFVDDRSCYQTGSTWHKIDAQGSETCSGTENCCKDNVGCATCTSCGDGSCNGGETCSTCSQDCGPCCTLISWYADNDNDFYYNGTNVSSCTRPAPFWKNVTEINSTTLIDCNDSNSQINHGMIEICGNGVDENCDWAICISSLNKPYWANASNYTKNISSVSAGTNVLMVVLGNYLYNQNISYKIYNSTNSLIYSNSSLALNDSYGSILWNASKAGTYSFNITLISTGQVNKSGSLIVIPSAPLCINECSFNEEEFSCNGTSKNIIKRKCINDSNNCFNWTGYSLNKTCLSNQYCENGQCLDIEINPPSVCSEINNSADCLSASNTLILNSFNDPSICGGPFGNGTANCYQNRTCKCLWQNGNCTNGYTASSWCGTNPPVPFGNCSWTTTKLDKCNQTENSFILSGTAIWRNITGNPIRDSGCVDYSRSIPCISSAKLPFFSLFNIVVVLLGLVVVYSIFGKKFR
jgi:hypothetical protein